MKKFFRASLLGGLAFLIPLNFNVCSTSALAVTGEPLENLVQSMPRSRKVTTGYTGEVVVSPTSANNTSKKVVKYSYTAGFATGNYYILVKNAFTYDGNSYDVRYDFLKYDNSYGNYYNLFMNYESGNLWFSAKIDDDRLNRSTQVGGLKVKLSILEAGTNTLAHVPVKYLRIGDFDCGESFRIPGLTNDSFFIETDDKTDLLAFDSATSTVGASINRDTQDVAVDVLIEKLETDGNITFVYDRLSDGFGGAITALVIRQFTVDYVAEAHGSISHNTQELLDEGIAPKNLPTATPESENYEFAGWVADKDILLKDDNIITAGTTLAASQISNIHLNKDLVLTAKFTGEENEEPEDDIPEEEISTESPDAPDGGTFSKMNSSANVSYALEFLMFASALYLFGLRKILHKINK